MPLKSPGTSPIGPRWRPIGPRRRIMNSSDRLPPRTSAGGPEDRLGPAQTYWEQLRPIRTHRPTGTSQADWGFSDRLGSRTPTRMSPQIDREPLRPTGNRSYRLGSPQTDWSPADVLGSALAHGLRYRVGRMGHVCTTQCFCFLTLRMGVRCMERMDSRRPSPPQYSESGGAPAQTHWGPAHQLGDWGPHRQTRAP